MMGLDILWHCETCGKVHFNNLGICDLYSLDNGLANECYVGQTCDECMTHSFITTKQPKQDLSNMDVLQRLQYRQSKPINEYFENAVIVVTSAENPRKVGCAAF